MEEWPCNKLSTKSIDLNKYIVKGESEYCGIFLTQLNLTALTVYRQKGASFECLLDELVRKPTNIVVFILISNSIQN